MIKQHTQNQDVQRTDAVERDSSAATIVGFAVIGCLVAGVVGILKALSMESGRGVLCCLLASVAAFGTVAYIYLRRN